MEEGNPLTILFVCATNTTLSPLAVVIAQNRWKGTRKLHFVSAGTYAGKTPRKVTHHALESAEPFGDLSAHRSQQLTPELARSADFVLCMSEEDFWYVKDETKSSETTRVRMITEFTEQLGVKEIADPLLGETTYEQAVFWLEKCIEGFFDPLIQGEDPCNV